MRRGEAVFIQAGRLRRLCVVTKVCERHVIFLLAHTFPELATDMDLVIPQGQVTPYPLVIQPDLYGTALHHQLTDVVGQVPENLLSAVQDSLWTDGKSVEPWCKTIPLQGRSDPRWTWKEEELKELMVLRDESLAVLWPESNGE